MQQNARQILNVVKGTFASQFFDKEAAIADDTHKESDGEILGRLWSHVVHALDHSKRDNTTEALWALTAVSLAWIDLLLQD